MIRKLVLAAAAIATLGTVSLTATTPAAAWGKGGGFHHHHHGFHGGFRGFRVYSGYDSCLRTRWVMNRYGELVLRTYNICY
jgi:hypothetical protein